jgi:hypothetical protein
MNETQENTKAGIWYETPIGSFPTYEEAYQKCLDCDFDPSICIKPIVE